jgi:hypothetical protein
VARSQENEQANRRGQGVSELIEGLFGAALADTQNERTALEFRALLRGHVAEKLDAVITHRHRSYRDAALLQLAFGVLSDGPFDHCIRQPGGRGAAGRLGTYLAAHHIAAVQDALQNVGKNTSDLCRGNVAEFDELLHWANAAGLEARRACLRYAVTAIALTARPVLPMPAIDRSKLTFVRVAKLFHTMLGAPSQGIHQQMIVAACLEAIIDEFDMGGTGGVRVDTKNVSASDVSAGVPGDIQIKRGNRAEEAFEVTANPWLEKAAKAARLIREQDLPRAHIVAAVTPAEFGVMQEFDGATDISVLDIGSFVRTLVAVMRKPAREPALVRVYQLLDRVQRDIGRTNQYVTLLQEHGLSVAPE